MYSPLFAYCIWKDNEEPFWRVAGTRRQPPKWSRLLALHIKQHKKKVSQDLVLLTLM